MHEPSIGLPDLEKLDAVAKYILQSVYKDGVDEVSYALAPNGGVEGRFIDRRPRSDRVFEYLIKDGVLEYSPVSGVEFSEPLMEFSLYPDEDGLYFTELDFAASSKKTCKKGKPCGSSCIARGRTCRIDLKGNALKLAEVLRGGRTNAVSQASQAESEKPKSPPPLGMPSFSSGASRITSESFDASLRSIKTEGMEERLGRLQKFMSEQQVSLSFTNYRGTDPSARLADAKSRFEQLPDSDKAKLLATTKPLKGYEKQGALVDSPGVKQMLEQAGYTNPGKLTSTDRAAAFFMGEDDNTAGRTSAGNRFVVVTPDDSSKAGPFKAENVAETIQGNLRKAKKVWTHNSEATDPDTGTLITAIHETGHQVKYRAQETTKKRVARPDRAKAVTQYGDTNDDEWFAEAFVSYMVDAKAYRKFDKVGHDYIEATFKEAAKE